MNDPLDLSVPGPAEPGATPSPEASRAPVVTAADIEAEHQAALETLTPAQRRALERLANARQRTNFNGRFPQENLKAIFSAEAQARSRGPDPG